MSHFQLFTFACDYQPSYHFGSIHSDRTEHRLDVPHYKLHVGEEEIAADLEEATYHCEHHNMNLNFVGKFALSRPLGSHGYPVVLTGEGADEQFPVWRVTAEADQSPADSLA